jgi:hypothetical protein
MPKIVEHTSLVIGVIGVTVILWGVLLGVLRLVLFRNIPSGADCSTACGDRPLGQAARYCAPSCLARYRERVETHHAHATEIQRRHCYRDFHQQPEHFRLVRWVYTRAWVSAERPIALFDLTTARLVKQKILLPGVTTLTRLVASIRDRAAGRLWRILLNYRAQYNAAGCSRCSSPLRAATAILVWTDCVSVAQDDVVDLLHQLIGTKLLRAEHTGERERLRNPSRSRRFSRPPTRDVPDYPRSTVCRR